MSRKKKFLYPVILGALVIFSTGSFTYQMSVFKSISAPAKTDILPHGTGIGGGQKTFSSGRPDPERYPDYQETPYYSSLHSGSSEPQAGNSTSAASASDSDTAGMKTKPRSWSSGDSEDSLGNDSAGEQAQPAAAARAKKTSEIKTANPLPSDDQILQSIQEQKEKQERADDLVESRWEQAQVVKNQIAQMSSQELMPPAESAPPASSSPPSAEVIQQVQSEITTVH